MAIGNSCSFLILPSWGYRGGEADMDSVSAADCFHTVDSLQQRETLPCKQDLPQWAAYPEPLHNLFKCSSPLQVLLDCRAGLICLIDRRWASPFFPWYGKPVSHCKGARSCISRKRHQG